MPGVIQTGCAAEFAHAVVIAASSAPGARLPDGEITFQLDPPALAVPVKRISPVTHKIRLDTRFLQQWIIQCFR
jgi:hypothetical protein